MESYCVVAGSMPFQFSDFLSGNFDPVLQSRVEQIAPLPQDLAACLLCGPPRSGKTAILLHFAHKLAAQGKVVVVLCQRNKLELGCPILPYGVDKADTAWKNVHMRYLGSSQELQKYAACLHLANRLPDAIVIDDISEFLQSRPTDKRARDAELIKTLAMLHEAIVSINRQEAGSLLQLLMSDSTGPEGPRNLYMFERWCPLMLTIEVKDGVHILSILPTMADTHLIHSSCMQLLQFSPASQAGLSLEAILPRQAF